MTPRWQASSTDFDCSKRGVPVQALVGVVIVGARTAFPRRAPETAWTDEKGTTITMRLDEGDDPEGREYFAVSSGLKR